VVQFESRTLTDLREKDNVAKIMQIKLEASSSVDIDNRNHHHYHDQIKARINSDNVIDNESKQSLVNRTIFHKSFHYDFYTAPQSANVKAADICCPSTTSMPH